MAMTDNQGRPRAEQQTALHTQSSTDSQAEQKAGSKAGQHVEQVALVDSGSLTVSVVWASPVQVSSVSIVVPVGTRVGQALELSGLLTQFKPAGISVFGQRCDLTRILSDGDRIELCRPLIVEPKAARRRRALHREKVRNIKKKMPIDDLTV
jgi:hypothetical protein